MQSDPARPKASNKTLSEDMTRNDYKSCLITHKTTKDLDTKQIQARLNLERNIHISALKLKLKLTNTKPRPLNQYCVKINRVGQKTGLGEVLLAHCTKEPTHHSTFNVPEQLSYDKLVEFANPFFPAKPFDKDEEVLAAVVPGRDRWHWLLFDTCFHYLVDQHWRANCWEDRQKEVQVWVVRRDRICGFCFAFRMVWGLELM